MAVTADKYELPIAVADTSRKLASMLGISSGEVRSRKVKNSSGKRSGYRVYTIEDKEEVWE